MLSSSLNAHHKYAHAVAYSPSGKLGGPSSHPAEPLLQDDRGHGMIFRTFDGSLRLAGHRYFSLPKTCVQIWNLHDEGHRLSLGSQLLGRAAGPKPSRLGLRPDRVGTESQPT